MEEIFFELTIIVGIAAVLSILFRFFKQPSILAYILAGVLIGPIGLFSIDSTDVLHSFAQIGITLLLFLLGLELRISDLKSVGKVSLVTGLGQIIFTSVIGYGICMLLGFSPIASAYISIALTFSSTIIIVKLLSDKKDLNSLYGRISVGFLLIQDFVAIIALIILSGFTPGSDSTVSVWTFAGILVKAVVLFSLIILLSRTLLPKVMHVISRNGEILFLFSLAWAFGMSAIFSSELVGFSIEIGGFLAGLALANSVSNFQIVAKVRPLRDFFITIFFVSLGSNLLISHIESILIPSILLSLFVLIGNPLIVLILLGSMGYRSRTAFLSGLTVAQISEFSMIVVFMGNQLGHVSDEAVSLVTVVGAVTFISSTYMIMNGNKLYTLLRPILVFFEKEKARDKQIQTNEMKNHVVLIGANRMGESILDALVETHDDVFVVDFDPEVIKRLQGKNIPCIYGDIVDDDIQEKAFIENARLVVSTVPDLEDNLLLLESLKQHNKKALSIVFALERHEAKELYEKGADYVVLPHLAGGRHLAKILVDSKHMELIEDFKARDKSYLE